MHTKCADNALAAAVSSTVIIFLVISILMFIGGFMSGLCVERKFLSKEKTAERPHPVPFYDDVQIFRAESDIANQEEQNLELKKNVAYRLPKPVPIDVN